LFAKRGSGRIRKFFGGSVMIIIPTFHCGGNCSEVLALYQKAFNMTIDWQGKDEETGFIYHTEARIGDQRIRLSDGGNERNITQADSLFLAVVFDTVPEAEKTFEVLAEGGTVIQAPHRSDFATCMSELKDRFGFKWFLMVD
jgi:PhnB protein